MPDYLTVNGSSFHKIFVHCKRCMKQYVWLKVIETSPGYYTSTCSGCVKELRKNKKLQEYGLENPVR